MYQMISYFKLRLVFRVDLMNAKSTEFHIDEVIEVSPISLLCLLNLYLYSNVDRGEVPKGSAEIFFRKVKFWNEDGEEDAPPVFVGILFTELTGSVLLLLLMHID